MRVIKERIALSKLFTFQPAKLGIKTTYIGHNTLCVSCVMTMYFYLLPEYVVKYWVQLFICLLNELHQLGKLACHLAMHA